MGLKKYMSGYILLFLIVFYATQIENKKGGLSAPPGTIRKSLFGCYYDLL